MCRLLSMPATDGLISLSVRCIQPIQQQGRRSPFLILSRPTLTRLVRVSASLPLVTQQIHSLRVSGVMSCHKLSAFLSPAMAAAKSSGSLCTVPPGNLEVIMSLFYQIPPFSKEYNLAPPPPWPDARVSRKNCHSALRPVQSRPRGATCCPICSR